MLGALTQITGWKVERKVPAEMLSKENFRKFVDDGMKESSSGKQAQAQETVLKMFGLVPPEFNLMRESAELVTEQAAAFYDYKKKRLFILDSTTDSAEQRIALVHELAHALADQHHPLGKFMKHGSPDDDATTARQAVTEGQATWLTWAYLSLRTGGKPEVPKTMIDMLSSQVGAEGDAYPVFTKAPLYIRDSLVFPYTQGLRFQDAVFREKGQASFDQVFDHPPASTQQVMHADVYFSGRSPSDPKLAELETFAGKDAKRYREQIDGALGEFDIAALLRQFLDEHTRAGVAEHWRGGSFRLYQNKSTKRPALQHVAQWDSPESARAYFAFYQQMMHKKWKAVDVDSATATEIRGHGDSGRFLLRLDGDTVQCVEGLE